MADLTADAVLRVWGTPVMRTFILDTSSAQTIYKGQPLIVDQSTDATGPVVGYVDATVVAADDVFVGIAAGGKTVASGVAETVEKAGIVAYTDGTILGFKSAVFTNGVDQGKTVYMSDSGTLSTTVGDNPMIGKLMWVEDGYAYVKLALAICTGA